MSFLTMTPYDNFPFDFSRKDWTAIVPQVIFCPALVDLALDSSAPQPSLFF